MKTTIKAKLLAIRDDHYTVYVFENVNEKPSSEFRYVMCTKPPNWDPVKMNIGDIGYLQYECVLAGDTTYYKNGESIPYQYSNCYFINWIKEKPQIDNIQEYKF